MIKNPHIDHVLNQFFFICFAFLCSDSFISCHGDIRAHLRCVI